MKITYVFNVPEEAFEHAIFSEAEAFYDAVVAIQDHIRSRLKYFELSEGVAKELEAVRELLPALALEKVFNL